MRGGKFSAMTMHKTAISKTAITDLEKQKLATTQSNTILSSKQNSNSNQGFTLVELLVVLAILAMLLTLAVPKYFNSLERAKEATLKQDLNTLRDSLDKYYADTGQYPNTLEDLVEKKYIRKMPFDPITESTTTWILDAPEPPIEGDIADIHSGALGVAKDGTQYSQW